MTCGWVKKKYVNGDSGNEDIVDYRWQESVVGPKQ